MESENENKKALEEPSIRNSPDTHGISKTNIRIIGKITFVPRWLFEQEIALSELGKSF